MKDLLGYTLLLGLAWPLSSAAQVERTPPTVSTLAGSAAGKGKQSLDGAGTAARFDWPMGLAVAADGTVYVTDTYQHTIRQITPAGLVTTLAGSPSAMGSQDGLGAVARFNHPVGLAVASTGVLYVADIDNHTIRSITPAGPVQTVAGAAGSKGSVDGPVASARFNSPYAVVPGSEGELYVADTYNHTIRKITAAGVVSILAGLAGSKGYADGAASQARFNHPSSIARATDGTLYVADDDNQLVRKITPAGVVTTLAGTPGKKGFAEGPAQMARFHAPTSVAVSATGTVYVADYINSIIRQITPDGQVSTFAGRLKGWGHLDGNPQEARFKFPFGVAVGPTGWVYVADTGNRTIRLVK
jgi:sugar lactone lactonase YvrE